MSLRTYYNKAPYYKHTVCEASYFLILYQTFTHHFVLSSSRVPMGPLFSYEASYEDTFRHIFFLNLRFLDKKEKAKGAPAIVLDFCHGARKKVVRITFSPW